MTKANILIAKRKQNMHQYLMMGTPDEYVPTSPKSQVNLSKPSWVQSLSMPVDQRGLLVGWRGLLTECIGDEMK